MNPKTVLRQDTLLLYNPKESGERKKVCPFFLLENSRPLSPWGPLDSLSTCLGTESLSTDYLELDNPCKKIHECREFCQTYHSKPCFILIKVSSNRKCSFEMTHKRLYGFKDTFSTFLSTEREWLGNFKVCIFLWVSKDYLSGWF